MPRGHLVKVFEETKEIFGHPSKTEYSYKGKKVYIDPRLYNKSINMTKKIKRVEAKKSLEQFKDPVEIEVIETDTTSAGMKLQDEKYNVVIMNMASEKKPGGGVCKGSSTQEETLCRQSGLYFCLDQYSKLYPWKGRLEGFYSPSVPFIRDLDLDLVPEPYYLSVISMAMLRYGIPKKSICKKGDEKYEVVYNKIKKFLLVALNNEHDAVVLGAWGCGAFGNDAYMVATIFKDVIESEFKFAFRKIVFAILRDRKQDNIGIFEKVFSEKTIDEKVKEKPTMTQTKSGKFLLNVNVIPNSKEPEINLTKDHVSIYITNPTTKGKANEEVIKILSDTIGIDRRIFSIEEGKKSQNKVIAIPPIKRSDEIIDLLEKGI